MTMMDMIMGCACGLLLGVVLGIGFFFLNMKQKSPESIVWWNAHRLKKDILQEVEFGTGRSHFEIMKKSSPESMLCECKDGILVLDPTVGESTKGSIFSNGLTMWTANKVHPIVLGFQNQFAIDRSLNAIRSRYGGELAQFTDDEIMTLMQTPYSELLHDCSQLVINLNSDIKKGQRKDSENIPDGVRLKNIIVDCQELVTSLSIIPDPEIVVIRKEEKPYPEQSEDVVIRDDDVSARKGLKGIVENIINPPKKVIIRKTGTALYPPRYYFSCAEFAHRNVPYNKSTQSLRNIIDNEVEIRLKKKNKGLGDLMPIGILILMSCIGIAVLMIVAGMR